MTWRKSTAAKAAALAAWTALFDAGSGPAKLRIYTGSAPAGPNSSATGTLLLEFTLNDPATDLAGAFSTSPAVSATAGATGTAGWGRVLDSNNLAVADGTVGTEITMSSTSVVSSTVYQFTGGTITEG
jgi:hypothetical protein